MLPATDAADFGISFGPTQFARSQPLLATRGIRQTGSWQLSDGFIEGRDCHAQLADDQVILRHLRIGRQCQPLIDPHAALRRKAEMQPITHRLAHHRSGRIGQRSGIASIAERAYPPVAIARRLALLFDMLVEQQRAIGADPADAADMRRDWRVQHDLQRTDPIEPSGEEALRDERRRRAGRSDAWRTRTACDKHGQRDRNG